MTTDEMVKDMTSHVNKGSFSVYGSYERQDDEHGWFEVDYNELEIMDDGEVIVYYDCVFTDHEHHFTEREHERDYFENLPMDEQIDLYEIVMES